MLSISSSHRDVVVFARHQACDRRSSSTRLHIPTVHHVAHLYFNFSSEIGLSSICGWPHGVTMSWHRVQVASPVSVRLSLNWTSGKKGWFLLSTTSNFRLVICCSQFTINHNEHNITSDSILSICLTSGICLLHCLFTVCTVFGCG